MNDSHETTWIDNILDTIIPERQKKSNTVFYDSLIKNYNIKKFKSYMICFSEQKDLLSQWRGYTYNASGVSIGFNPNKLDLYYKLPSNNISSDIAKSIVSVIYDKEIQCNIINNILNYYEEINDYLSASNLLRSLSYLFKNESFQTEEEWRIIYIPIVLQNMSNPRIYHERHESINFRIKEQDLIEYYEYLIEGKLNSDFIKEIVLGPKCKVDIESLKFMLSKYGLHDTVIETSTSTFR